MLSCSAQYHHCKVAAGWSQAHELVWLYAGSHNFSGAAWGKLEPKLGGGWEVITLSYELGVLYVPPMPLSTDAARALVPWHTPARRYGPTTVPYSLELVGSQLTGKGVLFETSSKYDVAAAAAAARRIAASRPLPRLLTCSLGQLHDLLLLRATSDLPILPQLPLRPSGRKDHLMLHDLVPQGDYVDGFFVKRGAVPRGSTVVATHGSSFTVSNRAKAAGGDPTLTFYAIADELAGEGGGFVADRPCMPGGGSDVGDLDTTLEALEVVVPTLATDARGGGPPSGFLVLLLSRNDDDLNSRLLRDASEARATIDERCWGLLVLQSSRDAYDAAWSAGLSTTVEPPPPSHSDLVALQYDIAALPAVLLLAPNGKHAVSKLAGEQELVARGLCLGGGRLDGGADGGGSTDGGRSTDGGALAALLLGESTSREVASSRDKEAHRRDMASQMSKLSDFAGESSSAWIQQCGWRLLVINCEGVLKKPGGLSMPPVAPLRDGANDAFRSHAVPFLKALLVRNDSATHGAAADGELLETAPHIALVTDLGHQASERASGGELLDERRVRRVLDELLVRLGNELNLSPSAAAQLIRRTRIYHNFLPMSKPVPSDEEKRCDSRRAAPEWTHAWCRPQPGQLLQALTDHAVQPLETLMVSVNEDDEDAADAAGVASIRYERLLSGMPHEGVCLPGQRARRGNGKAPAAFVPQ